MFIGVRAIILPSSLFSFHLEEKVAYVRYSSLILSSFKQYFQYILFHFLFERMDFYYKICENDIRKWKGNREEWVVRRRCGEGPELKVKPKVWHVLTTQGNNKNNYSHVALSSTPHASHFYFFHFFLFPRTLPSHY